MTASPDPRPSPLPTEEQVSSGGVAFRRTERGVEVALVKTKPKGRWQLPKGIVDEGETPEETALREVREEAGLETAVVAPLDVIEYWYVGHRRGGRVRFHKRVHFFLLACCGGDVGDHDHEVEEARWVAVEEAGAMLAFPNERKVVARALLKAGEE